MPEEIITEVKHCEQLYEVVQEIDSCCLCPVGAKLQNMLIEHLNLQHPNSRTTSISNK